TASSRLLVSFTSLRSSASRSMPMPAPELAPERPATEPVRPLVVCRTTFVVDALARVLDGFDAAVAALVRVDFAVAADAPVAFALEVVPRFVAAAVAFGAAFAFDVVFVLGVDFVFGVDFVALTERLGVAVVDLLT
ncbi:MAG: hypothetical protein JWM98_1252, partial [Thermoleophilia bacterium]|nr:hypothetical protein [Thermoleophilia bacterium]